jgi:hypothetical protein
MSNHVIKSAIALVVCKILIITSELIRKFNAHFATQTTYQGKFFSKLTVVSVDRNYLPTPLNYVKSIIYLPLPKERITVLIYVKLIP